MKRLKMLVKNKLTQFIHQQVSSQSSLPTPLFGDAYWYAGPNLWEPPVLLSLKDLCRPGAVVFDVGGNMGGLSSAMSRLVGPRGIVCTFEASPRIIGHLQANMAKQGHHNVTVYHRAVYSRSDEIVTIYDGDHLNDSILAEHSPTKIGHPIKTLALDDFCLATGLYPEVVKMDIEGAEFDALNGFAHTIESAKPHFLLEQQASDMRCFDFLVARGYLAMDLNSYRQIKTVADYPPGAPLRNVLFIHADKIESTCYKPLMLSVDVASITAADFTPNHLNGYTSREFELESGRYLMDVDFSATGTNNNMMCGIRFEGLDLFRYHGYSKLISDSYRDWVVEVPRRGKLTIYFDFLQNTSDPSLQLRNVTVKKLDGCHAAEWAKIATD
jgi:FkbM family methyltransferase